MYTITKAVNIPRYQLVPFTSNGVNKHVPIPITIDQENNVIFRGDPAGRSIFVHDLDCNLLYSIKIHHTSLTRFAICLIREDILALTDVMWKSHFNKTRAIVEYYLITTGDFITEVQFELPQITNNASNTCVYSSVTNTLYLCTLGSLYSSSDDGIVKLQLNSIENELSNINGVAVINKSTEVVCSSNEGVFSVNPYRTLYRSYLQVENMSRFVMLTNDLFCGIKDNSRIVLGSLRSKTVYVIKQPINYLTKHDIAIHRKSGRIYITCIDNTLQIIMISKLINLYKSFQ